MLGVPQATLIPWSSSGSRGPFHTVAVGFFNPCTAHHTQKVSILLGSTLSSSGCGCSTDSVFFVQKWCSTHPPFLACWSGTPRPGIRRGFHRGVTCLQSLMLTECEQERHLRIPLLATFSLWDSVERALVLFPHRRRPAEHGHEGESRVICCRRPLNMASLEILSNAPIPSI